MRLLSALTGAQNTGVGVGALFNTTGNNNTALGFGAGADLTGDNNIDIGTGRGLAGESNTIRIGDNVSTTEGASAAYVGGVNNQPCDPDSCFVVGADVNNKLGTHTTSAARLRVIDVLQDHKKVAELEATVATLATQLKEQAARIQKITVPVQLRKPTKEVALNSP